MKTITRLKDMDKIENSLAGDTGVCIVGCGTCATMCRTGGQEQVAAMKRSLQALGKVVTGTLVVPTACDELSPQAVRDHKHIFEDADAVLAMTCAFGVQTLASTLMRPVIPALDTLFLGKEQAVGSYSEICMQCGECVLEDTAGICPVTACHKGLLNGPCGGTNKGKCEIGNDTDCAWAMIYNRLQAMGRLDRMRKYQPPKNYQAVPKPGKVQIPLQGSEAQ